MNYAWIKKDLKIIIRGHVLNWPWRSKEERRKIRGAIIQEAVCDYLSKYINAIQSVKEDGGISEGDKERIFSIWLQGGDNAPDIVKACWRSIRHNCSQELVVLDEKSLWEWIELPEYIMRKRAEGKIKPAHFADICRVELLYQYGGVWLDATDFVTSPIPEEIMEEDFFIYLCGPQINGGYTFIQNCFFRSRKGNFIIKAWREAIHEYWKNEDGTADYFVHQLLFKMVVENNAKAAELFSAMPKIEQDPTHALWWSCRSKTFDRKLFEDLTRNSFYQKVEYKSKYARKPVRGSFSDIMQNMYR